MNNMSQSIDQLMTALAKAQGKIQPALKDKSNPFFKSKYADLTSVWNACREVLSENGLAVVQSISRNDNGMSLLTILGHASGQWISSDMPIIMDKIDPQSMGKIITYYRRYSLSAIVGVSPDDDDDGETAQQPYRNGNKYSQKVESINAYKKPTNSDVKPLDIGPKISQEQADEIDLLLKQCDPEFFGKMQNHFAQRKWFRTVDILLSHFDAIKTHIKTNIQKNIKNEVVNECVQVN